MTANAAPFLGSASSIVLPGKPALLGCPLDMTATFRSGTGDSPCRIRMVSDSIETYSPFLDEDLEDFPFADVGDVDLAGCAVDEALQSIKETVAHILGLGGLPLCLGGEHTITLPIVQALAERVQNFVVLHLDAHSDLRDSYEGNRTNHATVMRRVSEIIGPNRLIQLGIRSGTREEFAWMRQHHTLLQWMAGSEKNLRRKIAGAPVYLSVDLDVLDPACFPATGNPEPGGWFYEDFQRLLPVLKSVPLIGADVVELNPGLDPSDVGSITAAKVVRELLLTLGK
ncbi:MAG: agmatinase [Thermodesulfobacteriota bacterium]